MEKIKENRALSFIIISAIYGAAIGAGLAIYRLMPYAFWLNLLIADVAATVLVFIASVCLGNASVYDPYWSVQPAVILIAYAAAEGLNPARWLMLIAVCFWAVRLTANWTYTFKGLNHQDWRYTMLKEKTGVFYPLINFIGIHMVPTLVVYGCILPAVFIFQYQAQWNLASILCIALSIGAALLQMISDLQMQRYRRDRKTPFIRSGLWKYSRHPNYLGEILMWWGIGLAALAVLPQFWFLPAGALANTLLFICVSLPMAERRQGKKEGFAEYKTATRLLLPIKK